MDNFTSPLDQQDINGLVVNIQQGDTEAFSKLYDLLVDKVYRYLYFRAPKEDTEDLTELVFLKIWENIQKYRPEKVPFLAWVFRIAHNTMVDHYRVHRPLSSLREDTVDQRLEMNPKEVMEQNLNGGLLKQALSCLKDRYQQILVLRFINELDVAETALALNLRPGMVRVLQWRAIQALKKILQQMGIKYL